MTSKSNPMRVPAAVAALALVMGLGACNTVSGAGEDIKQTGKAIEDTAEKSKPK